MLNEQDKQEIRELLREALAARRLMTSKQVAKYLGITPQRWATLVSSRPGLKLAAVPLGTRGEGTERRWDISLVLATLRQSTRARKARPQPASAHR